MRAASGKPFDDSSSEDSSSETAREAENSMHPPESPATKRGPGRPRTKSASAQPSDPPPEAARTRRRSSSLRGKVESTLPVVDEQTEDADNVVVASNVGNAEKAELATDNAPASEPVKVENEAKKKDEKVAIKEAAEAQKKEEDSKKKNEDELKAREAEEKARQAEEEAEKQRLAEEAKSRQEEEEKKAEAARKAEEQRQRLETELSEARSRHRQELASSLPDALSRILDPTLDSKIEQARLENEVLQIFTPLQVLPGAASNISDPTYKSRADLVVLNAQAAPLLGKVGLELLLHSDAPGYDKSLARDWTTFSLTEDEEQCVRAILPGHLLSNNPLDEDSMITDEDVSFEAELARTACRIKKAHEAQAQFDSASIELRWVKLQDVLDNLHPALQGVSIDVRADFCRPKDQARIFKHAQTRGEASFFDGVFECWKQEALPEKLELGTTEVRITHEK